MITPTKISFLLPCLAIATLAFALYFVSTYQSLKATSSVDAKELFNVELPLTFSRVSAFKTHDGLLGQMILSKENYKITVARIIQPMVKNAFTDPINYLQNLNQLRKGDLNSGEKFLITFYESQLQLHKVTEVQKLTFGGALKEANAVRFRGPRNENYLSLIKNLPDSVISLIVMNVGGSINEQSIEENFSFLSQ